MDNKTTVVEGTQVATLENKVSPAETTEEMEARLKAIEIERDNYKAGLLKEKAKNKGGNFNPDESEDDRIARIVEERLAQKKLTELDSEKEAIYQKAIKENKELKLAQLNKTTTPASVGTHSESPSVRDTLITPEQMTAFKAKGWNDKDIERYKKNLSKKV